MEGGYGFVVWLVQGLASGATLVARRPWTALLSRKRYAEVADHPLFRETNMVVTGVWTAYFFLAALMTALFGGLVALAFAVGAIPLGPLSFRLADVYSRRRAGSDLAASFAGMHTALDPAAAQDCVIGYEILTADGPVAWRVEIKGTEVLTSQTEPVDARVVLALSEPDYFRLVSGALDGTEAVMSGRMKIRGDMMFAMQIPRMFANR